MINACICNSGFKLIEIDANNKNQLDHALWIDLINPTLEEEAVVEQKIGLNIPTREELSEIELSSRLYQDNGALFMTATMIAHSATVSPEQGAISFVLTANRLITIRYIEPQAFKIFIGRLPRMHVEKPTSFLTELLDANIDRLADILEVISHQLETFSQDIFQTKTKPNTDYKELLQQLGFNGELNAKIVESLVSFNRLISFFDQTASEQIAPNDHLRLLTISKDINALTDHANFLSNKISFLLEATLGMVQIEQNAIIKIFSVAAVIFLPPTLIASIYGMNFRIIPELSWKYGYAFAIALMLFASWLPYKYFKYRKWL